MAKHLYGFLSGCLIVCPLTLFVTQRLFGEVISMKLATNIDHLSGRAEKVFTVGGQRSRSLGPIYGSFLNVISL